VLAAASGAAVTEAASADERLTLHVRRAPGPIRIDGDLSDPGWADATPIDAFLQITPPSKEPPPVRTVAFLAFDDEALYVGFELEDREQRRIRAPLTDRDNALSSSDYAGIVIDGPDDGKTAQEFLVNPRGVQYDAIWSDIVGEDLTPNFHWQSAARLHARGWTLEMRIPFASIRYVPGPNPVWGVTLIRNWPRERRYEFATAAQPTACFICNQNRLVGLEGLPRGGSFVLAPFATARRSDLPAGGVAGSPLVAGEIDDLAGLDLKWNPSARHTIDVALRPDFSQVESDVAQIAVNQRFALFVPERRPFFLEQIDLFSTPLNALYTRTVTDPEHGLRATGRFGESVYTLLVAEDSGGGSVVIPGPTSSSLALRDFESTAVLGRWRRDFGESFLSFLASDRQASGSGSNRVFGPDFLWRAGPRSTFTGQVLWSRSATPDRPDLAAEWDGRELAGHAALLAWSGGVGRWGLSLEAQDIDEEFRADNGFMPRVGFRQLAGEAGRFRRVGGARVAGVRFFTRDVYAVDRDGDELNRFLSAGLDVVGAHTSRLRLQLVADEQRVGDELLEQRQLRFRLLTRPTAFLAQLIVTGYAGTAIDFDNRREGEGAGLAVEAVLRSPKHHELKINAERNVLDVDPLGTAGGRLFTADLLRIRWTWTFTPRFFARAIVQRLATERDPALYLFPVPAKRATVEHSLLLAWKRDWQSVIYLGLGDSRAYLPALAREEIVGREYFLKVSWALRR
jgi:hypothetical protein